MKPNERMALRQRVAQAFRPTAPIDVFDLFAGRTEQIRTVMDAIPQVGQHVIVYGERGVGKTSLASVVASMMQSAKQNAWCPHVNCDSTDSFDTVWRKVFDQIEISRTLPGHLFSRSEETTVSQLSAELPESLTPDVVRHYLDVIGRQGTLLVIIDEFDCLPSGHKMFAETIKLLSDRAVPATVVIVGVGDSVADLIREHASVERAMVQVCMPRMSKDELKEIVKRGVESVPMGIDDDALDLIATISQGLPHYTHLLAMQSAWAAVEEGQTTVTNDHRKTAVHEAIKKGQQSIKTAYHTATMSPRKVNLYETVLLSCSLVHGDDHGYFTPADVREPMRIVSGQDYDIPNYSKHLHDFCEPDRGAVLKRIGSQRNYRFRFSNPLLQPYVALRGLAHGLITDEKFRLLQKQPKK